MLEEGSLQLAEPRHPSSQAGGPVCFVKGTSRRSDRGIEIHVVGIGHHPEDLLGGRIDGLEDLARSRRPQLTVDQQALFADDGGRVGGDRVGGAHRASCPVPTPKMSSQRSSVRVAMGSVTPRVPATSRAARRLSLIHISEPTRLGMISYAVFCLKKKKKLHNEHIQ